MQNNGFSPLLFGEMQSNGCSLMFFTQWIKSDLKYLTLIIPTFLDLFSSLLRIKLYYLYLSVS
jgi:hypothetical protein